MEPPPAGRPVASERIAAGRGGVEGQREGNCGHSQCTAASQWEDRHALSRVQNRQRRGGGGWVAAEESRASARCQRLRRAAGPASTVSSSTLASVRLGGEHAQSLSQRARVSAAVRFVMRRCRCHCVTGRRGKARKKKNKKKKETETLLLRCVPIPMRGTRSAACAACSGVEWSEWGTQR